MRTPINVNVDLHQASVVFFRKPSSNNGMIDRLKTLISYQVNLLQSFDIRKTLLPRLPKRLYPLSLHQVTVKDLRVLLWLVVMCFIFSNLGIKKSSKEWMSRRPLPVRINTPSPQSPPPRVLWLMHASFVRPRSLSRSSGIGGVGRARVCVFRTTPAMTCTLLGDARSSAAGARNPPSLPIHSL
jgi:hypothetical protein